MAALRSRMTVKGQVTVPVEVRRELNLKPGDFVGFTKVNGHLVIEKVESRVDEFFGFITPRNRPEDWDAVRHEVERSVALDVIAEG